MVRWLVRMMMIEEGSKKIGIGERKRVVKRIEGKRSIRPVYVNFRNIE